MKKTRVRTGKRQQVFAVPVRWHGEQLEFCLISPWHGSRWEFPCGLALPGEAKAKTAVRCANKLLKAKYKLLDRKPLDEFVGKMGNGSTEATAYLLNVAAIADEPNCRILWCLAEEARVRIRRKPLRRLVDLAVRHQAAK